MGVQEMSTEQRRMAKLYFKTEFGKMAKDMAARIRNQNSHCNLVDQQHFKGPDDVSPAALVLIQKSSKNAKLIATCYEKFGSDGAQIAFFDDEGNVVAENDESEKPETVSGPVAKTEDASADNSAGTGGPASVQKGDSDSDPADEVSGGIPVK
jgi:hypothetical protein